jgi:hypothetical protein
MSGDANGYVSSGRDTVSDEKFRLAKAISASDVSALGHNLPLRHTLARWSDSKVAEEVARILESRAKK